MTQRTTDVTLAAKAALPRQYGTATFVNNDYIYVTDNTVSGKGQYNQVIVDTLGLQLAPGQVIIPELSFWWCQHYVQATVANAVLDPMAIGIKNGFPFINACQVRLAESVVNNQQGGLSYINNLRYLRSWSDSKEALAGSTFYFHPPTRDSAMSQLLVSTNNPSNITTAFGAPMVNRANNNIGVPTPFNMAASYPIDRVLPNVASLTTVWTAATGAIVATSADTSSNFVAGDVGKTLLFSDGTTMLITAVAAGPPNTASGFALAAPQSARTENKAEYNAIVLDTTQNPKLPPLFNEGLYKRILDINFPGAYNVTSGTTGLANRGIMSASTATNLAWNQPWPASGLSTGGTPATGTQTVLTINGIYPLDIFSEVFLHRGAMRERIGLTIQFNDIISTAALATAGNVATSSQQQFVTTNGLSGSVCPLIITPQGLGIQTTEMGLSNISTGINQQTRLYLRVASFGPTMPLMAPVAVRDYYDFQVQTGLANSTGITSGQQTIQITPGIARPREILGYFFYSAANGSFVNGLSQPPQMQLTCEEPGYSSPGIYFGPPNFTITVGSRQAFMNVITYQFDKYHQVVLSNFPSMNMDNITVAGLSGCWDQRNALQGDIMSLNLSRTTIPLQFLDGNQIYVTGTLYAPPSVRVDIFWVIKYLRSTKFNLRTKEVNTIMT